MDSRPRLFAGHSLEAEYRLAYERGETRAVGTLFADVCQRAVAVSPAASTSRTPRVRRRAVSSKGDYRVEEFRPAFLATGAATPDSIWRLFRVGHYRKGAW